MVWSQILCKIVGFTKTNIELFLLRHITTLTSIQARIIFFKGISCFALFITKTSPCNEDALTPHFYIVKLGLTGLFTIFLFLL